MGRYDFQSVGGSAADAIRAVLMAREEQQRRDAERALINKREQDRIDIERKRNEQADQDRDENRKLTQEQREYARINNMVSGSGAPSDVDQATYDAAKRFGLEGAFRATKAEQGAYKGDDEAGVPQYDVLPGMVHFQGGDKYNESRTQAQERAEQLRLTLEAQAERAAAADKAAAERVHEQQTAATERERDRAAMVGATRAGNTQWVIRGGRAIEIPKGQSLPGDKPYRAPQGAGTVPAGMKDDLATMSTLYDMAGQAETVGEATGWAGTGGLGLGSAKQAILRQTGYGDPKGQNLRDAVSNIKATIAKLRGGTSFTPNEQTLLESYTPTINDSDPTIKAKLADLKTFIATKRDATKRIIAGNYNLGDEAGDAGDDADIEYDANGHVKTGK